MSENTKSAKTATQEMIKVMLAYVDGQPIQVRSQEADSVWIDASTPCWDFSTCIYRVKPRVMPSIDWSAVHRRYNYLVVDQFRQGLSFIAKPSLGVFGWEGAGGVVGNTAEMFESFSPGDVPWRESMVSRWHGGDGV